MAEPNSAAMDRHLVATHLGKLVGNISKDYLASTQRIHGDRQGQDKGYPPACNVRGCHKRRKFHKDKESLHVHDKIFHPENWISRLEEEMPWLFEDTPQSTNMDTNLPDQPLSEAEKSDPAFMQDVEELAVFTCSLFELLEESANSLEDRDPEIRTLGRPSRGKRPNYTEEDGTMEESIAKNPEPKTRNAKKKKISG
jgi:hypothetical protein